MINLFLLLDFGINKDSQYSAVGILSPEFRGRLENLVGEGWNLDGFLVGRMDFASAFYTNSSFRNVA